MADAFIGEIRMVAFTFAPRGWAFCDGQLMPISQNTALFSLLGTTYGGDGRTTFALPNFMGRAPVSAGAGPGLTPHVLGQAFGQKSVTLLTNNLPAHSHPMSATSNAANLAAPSGQSRPGSAPGGRGNQGPAVFAPAGGGTVALNPLAIGPRGSGSPVNLMQPYLVLNFVICLQGEFPMRP